MSALKGRTFVTHMLTAPILLAAMSVPVQLDTLGMASLAVSLTKNIHRVFL